MEIFYPLIATIAVSLMSLFGALFLFFKKNILEKLLIVLIAFSAGSMMGSAFFDLIPESLELLGEQKVFIFVAIGFCLFFLLEKIFYWRHCHSLENDCKEHAFTYLNLIGDGFHNFLDGMLIAVSFLIDFKLGITTTLAVLLHEIPQEIGDFSVLIYGGMTRTKALILNLFSGLFAILGFFAVWFFNLANNGIMNFIIPIAAGGFLYISASDLVPELHKHYGLKKSISGFLFFVLGITFMYLIGLVE